MSKEIASGNPQALATTAAARTPPAGPDSASPAGAAAASPNGHRPPADVITHNRSANGASPSK